MSSVWRRLPVLAVVLSIGLLGACNRVRSGSREAAYVSAPQANLRDQVAAAYTKVGIVKNGERVEVLDRDRRFAKVRTTAGV